MTPADADTGSPAPGANQGPMGVEDAGLAIEGILAREEEAETEAAPEAPPEKPPVRKREVASAEAPPETPEEDEEPESEGEEEAPAEEEEESAEAKPEPLYTVRINGKEKQVPLDELKRGYSGQQWIQERHMALKAERESLEQEAAAVKQERAVYAQYLGQLAKQLDNGGEAEPDWEKLRAEDEYRFLVERQAWSVKQERKAAVQQEIQRTQALHRMDQERATKQQVQEGTRLLLEAIPAWKKPEAFEKDKGAIKSFMKSIPVKGGFTDEEIAQTYDPRAVYVLKLAMEMQNLKKAQLKPVQTARPATARPGGAEAQPGRPADLRKIQQRLKQTGSVDDAAAYFEQSGIAG